MSNAGAGAGDPLTNLLCDLARADGIHDFGTEAGPDRNGLGVRDGRNTAFVESIPGTSIDQWDEQTSLGSVFTETGFRATLENAIGEATKNNDLPPPEGVPVKPFTVKTGGPSFRVKAVPFKGRVVQEGPTFVDNLFGKETPENQEHVILQVDFNHHGFLTSLRGNARAASPARTVGYMWSAATVNDPASKTDPSESVFENGYEVKIQVHEQMSGPMTFGAGPYSPTDYTQNFMSKYNVELSGIETKGIFGKKKKTSASIKFQYGAQTAVISDSKGQNAKDQLKPFIRKIVDKIAYAGGESLKKLQFELATKWMQKRSGDWLQALHAKLYRYLTFEPQVNPAVNPFFVSHDQIAIAYALMMGIPSLYFFSYPSSGENRIDYIVVFDNRIQTPQQVEERTKFCVDRLNETRDIRETCNWYQRLLETRTTKLNQYFAAINASLDELINNQYNVSSLETALRDVLKDAMRYTFIQTLIPETVPDPRDTTLDPCVRYGAYQTLKRMMEQHGGREDDVLIPKSLLTKFEGSKVFKTLLEWKLEYEGDAGPNARRSMPSGQNKPNDDRDRFAFLAYIANSKDTEDSRLKNTIATKFKRFEDAILGDTYDVYINRLGERFSDNRKLRIEKGLRTLLSQGYVYLKTEPISDDEWNQVVGSIRGAAEDTPVLSLPTAGDPAPVSLFEQVKLFVFRMLGIPSIPDRYGPGIRGDVGPLEVPATGNDDVVADDPPVLEDTDDVQIGGWRSGGRPVDRQDLDTRQITDPPLHALIEAGFLTLTEGPELVGMPEDASAEQRLAQTIDVAAATVPGNPAQAVIGLEGAPEPRQPGEGADVYTRYPTTPMDVETSATEPPSEDVVMSTGPAPTSDRKRKYEAVTETPTGVSTGLKSSSSVVQQAKVIKANPTPADKVEYLIDAEWIPDPTGAGGGSGWTSPTGVHYDTLDEAWTAYETTLQSGGGNDPLASKGWTQQREGIWRDPLTLLDYTTDVALGFQKARDGQKGGAADTEKVTLEDPAVRDVLESLLLLAADQIVVDTDDMTEAVDSQREYYTRGVDLLEAIGKEGQSRELALATYDLLCRSRWIPTEVFQGCLGIDTAYEAETLKLFFSSLFSYSFMKAPEIKIMYLAELEGLYATIKPNPIKSTAEIRATAEGILTAVLKKNGIQYPPPPVEKGVVKPDLTAGPSDPSMIATDLNTSTSSTQDPSSQSGSARRPLFTTP